MTSILTNNGAMVALQTLKGINNDLETTQSQISTGKKVADASDNAAAWAISKTMESDVASFGKVGEGLAMGKSVVATARTAAEAVTEKLKEVKEKIVQAQDPSQDLGALQKDIESLTEQIESINNSAQFNGVNLVKGAAGGGVVDISDAQDGSENGIAVLSSLNRDDTGVTAGKIKVDAVDLTSATLGLDAIDVNDGGTGPADALAAIDAMITSATEAASSFGTAQNQIDSQADFVSKLSDAMNSGIGSMVDADMEAASARLKALQTQQQLGTQALSIANQAPQSVLSLFR